MDPVNHPLAGARYVALTTFRRTGVPVTTPVWIAAAVDGTDRLVVISVDGTGKTKRLAHTRRVEVQECDLRGRVAAGTPTYRGEAVVVRDAEDVQAVRTAVVAKYGWRARASDVADAVVSRVGISRRARAGIVIDLARTPVG